MSAEWNFRYSPTFASLLNIPVRHPRHPYILPVVRPPAFFCRTLVIVRFQRLFLVRTNFPFYSLDELMVARGLITGNVKYTYSSHRAALFIHSAIAVQRSTRARLFRWNAPTIDFIWHYYTYFLLSILGCRFLLRFRL